MLKIVFISGCILLTTISRGQEKDAVELTLDDCIQEALQNNIAIKTAKNNELIARSNQFQSLMNFLPSVTANINYDFFFGTTFDVNAARQVSATTNSSSPNISANWVLFNGLSNLNTRRQRNYEYKSASESVRDVQLTTEANILEFYLNVILGQENIKVAEERVTLLEAQLDREEKRESVGVGNMESVYNFRSQLATERLNLQNLRNDLQRNQLTLFQAMQLELAQINYQVAPIEISEDELLLEADPFDQVLQECLDINPGLNSAKASLRASEFQLKSAQGQRIPTISFFGRLGSNYSSNGATNPNEDPGESGRENFEADATFFEQMGYNQFEYMNFTLSIPLFARFQTVNQVQVARLNMSNAELDVAQANINITNAVQNVYLDLVTAQSTYVSARENLEALDQSYEFVRKRYETGNTDFYTYLESLNNKNRADIQLINAKYSIIFRKKILDIYRSL